MNTYSGLKLLETIDSLEEFNRSKFNTLYHLSIVDNLTKLIPTRQENNPKTNRLKTRVSVSEYIHGAVQALILPGYYNNYTYGDDDSMGHLAKAKTGKQEYTLYLYRINIDDIKSSTVVECLDLHDFSKNSIFDIILTSELAYGSSVRCEKIGTITIRMLSRQEYNNKWGESDLTILVTINTLLSNSSDFSLFLLNYELGSDDPDIQNLIDTDLIIYKQHLKKVLPLCIAFLKHNSQVGIDTINLFINKL